MPEAQERALRNVADRYAQSGRLKRRRGESLKAAKDRFVFGTLRKKHGWKPSGEKN